MLFPKVRFVIAPHALPEEVPCYGPNEQIYSDHANVIDRMVVRMWFSDQVLGHHCDEHESAPPQHTNAQHEALLPSSFRFLPTLPCLLRWRIEQRAVPPP